MDSSGNHFAQISLDRSPSYLVFFHSLREREREILKVSLKKKKTRIYAKHIWKVFSLEREKMSLLD